MLNFSRTVKCSQGHENPSETRFCARCGEMLQKSKAEEVHCPGCGKLVKASPFCPKCGFQLDSEAGKRHIQAEVAAAPDASPQAGLLTRTLKCSCGRVNKPDQRFCVACGSALAGSRAADMHCPQCKQPMKADAKHCPTCGFEVKDMQQTYQGQLVKNAQIWQRNPGEFATVISPAQESFFANGVVVEPGSTAVVLVDGAIAGSVEAGKYELEEIDKAEGAAASNAGALKRLWDTFRALVNRKEPGLEVRFPQVSILLIDTADTLLEEVEAAGGFSADSVKIDCVVSVFLSVANPVAFFKTVLKGARQYSVAEVTELVKPSLQSALKDALRAHGQESLFAGGEAEVAYRGHVLGSANTALAPLGVRVTRIQRLQLRQPELGRVAEFRSDTATARAQGQAEVERLQSETVVAQARSAAELERQIVDANAELATQQAELDVARRRAPVLEALLEAGNLEEMAKIRSQEELDRFLAPVMKEQLLREDELRLFGLLLSEKEEDRLVAVAHARDLLTERQRQEKALLVRQGLDVDLETDRLRQSHRREQEVADASTGAEVAALNASARVAEDRAKMLLEEEQESMHFGRFKEMQEMKRRRLEEEHRRELEKEQVGHKQTVEVLTLEQQHQLEMERLAAEVSLASIDKDKGVGLADAAAAREHAAEVARMQQERASEIRADSDRTMDRLERMFNTLAGASAESARQREEVIQRSAQKIEAMAAGTMDRVADVATARAAAPRPAIPAVLLCAKCHAELPPGTRFCTECGAEVQAG